MTYLETLMFPSKHPIAYYLLMVIVALCVIVGMVVLNQPLSLLALMFLQTPPFVQPQLGAEDESEEDGVYQTNRVGFTPERD